jgi:hypothetical protein
LPHLTCLSLFLLRERLYSLLGWDSCININIKINTCMLLPVNVCQFIFRTVIEPKRVEGIFSPLHKNYQNDFYVYTHESYWIPCFPFCVVCTIFPLGNNGLKMIWKCSFLYFLSFFERVMDCFRKILKEVMIYLQ